VAGGIVAVRFIALVIRRKSSPETGSEAFLLTASRGYGGIRLRGSP